MNSQHQDSAQEQTTIALQPQDISVEVLLEKYAKNGEKTIGDVQQRVSKALAAAESNNQEQHQADFLQAMQDGFVPAGRTSSAAGLSLRATLINCFVQPVGDSITGTDKFGRPSIYTALAESAETMRRGGGVGYNFGHIRPSGALVEGTLSRASGPISYMKVFDRSCETVESAGARRGAQMGVLPISHPDIFEFVHCKREKGAFNNFNLSVGVTDKFMRAVDNDDEWALVHAAPPMRKEGEVDLGQDENGKFIYKYIRARDLWNDIMQSTYSHAEPGILFLDRMNSENNLHYCETIEATNPCAEQPLPNYGCCCLGSINLTLYVKNPFSDNPIFDEEGFKRTVAVAVRMLDNVLDITQWPLPQQHQEAMNKRRIGLGYMGLGDAMIMLGIRYDTEEGATFAGFVSKALRDAAYRASVELAKEKGAFPLFDADKYLAGAFISRLPEDIKEDIRKYGIRNSHLLSIAPTGTISLAFADNASGGLEPAFSFVYSRKKRQADNTQKEFEVADHAYRLYRAMGGDVENLPPQFVTALGISVHAHVAVMKAIQPYIDTSLSKTVNVPAEYPFEDFQDLYMEAWKAGLKGLATYRPNSILGSVLSVKEEPKEEPKEEAPPVAGTDTVEKTLEQIVDEMYSQPFESRPSNMSGISPKATFYTEQGEQEIILTINFMDITRDTPYGKVSIRRAVEFLLTSNFTTSSSSWDAATRNISLAARYGAPATKIIKGLREITWPYGKIQYGKRMKDGKPVTIWHQSDAAVLGYIIEEELKKIGYLSEDGELAKKFTLEPIGGHSEATEKAIEVMSTLVAMATAQVDSLVEAVTKPAEPGAAQPTGKTCKECGASAVVKRDGCEFCTECGALGSCG